MATPAEEIKDPVDGIGCSRKRKEDARFIQGKGNYTDDLKLPGTVFGAFVRSPIAHGRVVSINKEPALAHPGVLAVLTAEDLAPLSLHWMPTLAGDKQMVLADGKVCFQQQEVAFVIAEDRYVAADAIELVEVEYEELPVIIDGRRAMDDDAPVIRDDLEGQTEGAHGERIHANHILDLRLRIQLRQNQRRANRLPDLAGAARGPHRRVDAVGHCRE
jgi:carbon-monoxide dehydrogenase large subunit